MIGGISFVGKLSVEDVVEILSACVLERERVGFFWTLGHEVTSTLIYAIYAACKA